MPRICDCGLSVLRPFVTNKVKTKIFNTFMHIEYEGPVTLLVVPFIEIIDTIQSTDKGLLEDLKLPVLHSNGLIKTEIGGWWCRWLSCINYERSRDEKELRQSKKKLFIFYFVVTESFMLEQS